MKLLTFVILLVIVKCAISGKCRVKKWGKYGGKLVFCGTHVFQYYKGTYYKIQYRPRPKPVGEEVITTTEAITTEAPTTEAPTTEAPTTEVSTEEPVEIEYDETSGVLMANRIRQLINSPKKCNGGFDALGDCIAPDQIFG